ncbi:hypothetical protein F0L68_37525 [Solihabitans fulvus]|uniref:Uncharacterized protein n=1 Tax=Solihabitans fulvus TaxID=1892852 RepID=A0A5B2WHM6_9PSEU|nr:hypothetical protein [Solihabitans fulvus]KAA2251331.1 hypothetical protein F0L68_37525 [Solihabitans fulvus]
MAMPDHDPTVLAHRRRLLIIADKGDASAEMDAYLTERGVGLWHPAYRTCTRPNICSHLSGS